MEASKQQIKSRIELLDNEERVKLIEEVQQKAIVWDLTDKKQEIKARHGTSVEGGDRQAGEDNRQAGKHAFWLQFWGNFRRCVLERHCKSFQPEKAQESYTSTIKTALGIRERPRPLMK
ncbi:hypothetical protein ACLKA7_002505 [Drosophila subpalustris]